MRCRRTQTPRRSSALRHRGLALGLAGILASCSGGDGEQAVVERFIAEDPQVVFDRSALFERETVFTWAFGSEAAEAWTGEGLEISRRDDRWRLQPDGQRARLVREVSLDADRLHQIELDLAGLRGMVELYWAPPGEEFRRRRRLVRKLPPRQRKKRARLVFDLASHREWRGEVGHLRLDFLEHDAIDLFSIRGFRREAPAERLAEAASRPWKLGLAADVRNVLLALPDHPLERHLEIAPDERLSFAYGAEPAADPVDLRVVAEPEGGAAETLFEARLDGSESGRWHERTLSLDAFAGRRVQLRLEAASARPVDPVRGFAAWAHPEVLGRAEEPALPNVIVISIDTLRADHLSAYGYELETSPEIDAWARDSAVLFRRVVAPAPWTIPSHASIFSGLDAYRHGVNHAAPVPAGLELLPEILRRAGYATAAFTGGGYFRPQFGFAQGFDVYRFWAERGSERQLEHGLNDLLGWLEDHRQRRFFAFFHTYEVHRPYRRRQPHFRRLLAELPAAEPPGRVIQKRGRWQGRPRWTPGYFAARLEDGSERRPSAGEMRWVRLMYDSGIAYVDAAIGRLLRRLDDLGLRGRTLVVLTSDHGEGLEIDRAGHDSLEDDNLLVPLIVELPGRRGAGEVVEEQVRSVDLMPTILDVLGLEPPAGLDGVSLLPVIAGDDSSLPREAWSYAATTNYGLGLRYADRLKYTLNNSAWAEVGGEEELRDLRRAAAPADGDGAEREKLRRLARRRMLEQHQGLRMRIANAGPGRLVGRLDGAWADVSRVKSPDPGCRCLSWDDGPAFDLEPAQEVTLLFETLPPTEATITAALERPDGSRGRLEHALDPHRVEAPVHLVASGAGWEIETGELDGVPTGFTIWRVGERQVEVAPAAIDAEAREQLRALGYVN